MTIRPISQLNTYGHYYHQGPKPRPRVRRVREEQPSRDTRHVNRYLSNLNDRDFNLYLERVFEGDPLTE